MAKHDNKAKPEREAFYDKAADTLVSGYTLIPDDIVELASRFGYSESSARGGLLDGSTARQAMSERGVALVVDQYKKFRVFKDGNLDSWDTDIEATQQRIQEIWTERTERAAAKRMGGVVLGSNN